MQALLEDASYLRGKARGIFQQSVLLLEPIGSDHTLDLLVRHGNLSSLAKYECLLFLFPAGYNQTGFLKNPASRLPKPEQVRDLPFLKISIFLDNSR